MKQWIAKCITLSGIVSFLFIVISIPLALPKIQKVMESVENSVQSGKTLVNMSIELLGHTDKVLGEAEISINALRTALPEIKTSVAAISENLKYWGEFSSSFTGITKKLSEIYKDAASPLPVNIPTGFQTTYKKINYGIAKLDTPTGLKPKYTSFFEKEKEKLLGTSSELKTLSEKIQETSQLMKTGSHGMDKDLEKSISASEESLKIASTEIKELRASIIPKYLAEMELQKKELEKTGKIISFADLFIDLTIVLLCVLSLLWAANGYILSGLIKKAQ